MQPPATHSHPATPRQYCIAALLMLALLVVPASAQPDSQASLSQADLSPQQLFEDFLHFARLGKFDLADAYARRLLEQPDLDPVELLRIADADRRSIDTLILIINNSSIGERATRILDLIREGEFAVRRDVDRIKANIEKLGGPPQMEHAAVQRLVESGEYAVPWMLRTLQDPARERLHARVLAALPKLGHAAVNPLVAALRTPDEAMRGQIIRVLGQIGYSQALPYLQKVLLDSEVTSATRAAAEEAIRQVSRAARRLPEGSPATAFFRLAEQYFDEHGSVAADPRQATANVWYWKSANQALEAIPVPQRIFGPVMAMRCCEEALEIDPADDATIALWLAADIRREARLGLNVESPVPGEPIEADETRPADFPPALYFTRTAGARHAHLVLERAVRDRDPAVALGAIAALRAVAGEASLIGTQQPEQPLVRALEFPQRLVRLRAALALANALPKSAFAGSEQVVPVLAGAIQPQVVERFVVVEPDAENLNRLAAALRQMPAEVIAESNFYKAMDRARAELDGVTAFFLATDMTAPNVGSAVSALDQEFLFAAVPVVLLVKPQEEAIARELGAGQGRLGQIEAGVDPETLPELLSAVRARAGQTPIDEALALELALRATRTLNRIALDGRTVLNHEAAEPALISALAVENEELRVSCVEVLAKTGTATAQRAVADVAFDPANSESLRGVGFAALAESAKRYGNLLDSPRVDRLLTAAREEADLVMRTAASQALGALNLADNKASEIIRAFHRG